MLTDKLRDWAACKKVLNDLEDEIIEEVLGLGTSITHGAAHVKFTKGTTKYDYEGIVSVLECDTELKNETIEANSTPSTTVKWKSVMETLGASFAIKERFKTVGDPKVVISLVE